MEQHITDTMIEVREDQLRKSIDDLLIELNNNRDDIFIAGTYLSSIEFLLEKSEKDGYEISNEFQMILDNKYEEIYKAFTQTCSAINDDALAKNFLERLNRISAFTVTRRDSYLNFKDGKTIKITGYYTTPEGKTLAVTTVAEEHGVSVPEHSKYNGHFVRAVKGWVAQGAAESTNFDLNYFRRLSGVYDFTKTRPMVEDPQNPMANEISHLLFAVRDRLSSSMSALMLLDNLDEIKNHSEFTKVFYLVKRFMNHFVENDFDDQYKDINADSTNNLIREFFTEEEINLLLSLRLLGKPFYQPNVDDKDKDLEEYIFSYAKFFNLCTTPDDLVNLIRFGDLLTSNWHKNNYRTKRQEEVLETVEA